MKDISHITCDMGDQNTFYDFKFFVSMLELPDDMLSEICYVGTYLNTCSNEAIIQSVSLVQRSHGLISSELLHETYARKDLSPVQSIDSYKKRFSIFPKFPNHQW